MPANKFAVCESILQNMTVPDPYLGDVKFCRIQIHNRNFSDPDPVSNPVELLDIVIFTKTKIDRQLILLVTEHIGHYLNRQII